MTDIPSLDKTGLRKFGITFGAIIAAIFGVLLPWWFGFTFPVWPWAVLAVFAAWAAFAPGTINPFYRLWMRFGLIMNAIMSRLILGAVFYLVVLPTGLIVKLRGGDPMRRKIDANARSYRIHSKHQKDSQMEKPF